MSTPTPQQQAAIAARGNVLVAAGAGTGKTSTVTERCLQLVLREKCSIEEILMVTFTEAAAAEMRERLRHRLREAADQATSDSDDAHWLAEQLALLDHAPISTLHSFCLGLVRRNFHALGLDPACVVLDDSQTKPLIHTVLNDLFLKHYASETSHAAAVRELIRTYGRGNDDDIRRLVVKIHQYTQTLADPANWFATQTALFSDESPNAWRKQFVEAVTDWARLWQNVLTASANESANVAASLCALAQLPATDQTFTQAAATVAGVVEADDAEWKRGTKTTLRKPLEGFFDSARFLHDLAQNDGTALAEDWQWSREPMLTLLRLVQEFSTAFAQAKRELGGIDFADQEQFALRLLLTDDRRPSEVACACREKFRYVFVDECQDINAAQDAILRAISRGGDASNRFLVGDVKQSIYRFRLADPRIFQNYEANWKSHSIPSPGLSATLSPSDGERDGVRGNSTQNNPGQTLALTENFRSAEGLLRFINPLFRTLMRPAVGGLAYDAAAELQFGNPAARAALSVNVDLSPRVRLHVLTKDDEANAGNDESENRGTKTAELADLPTIEREALLIATELRQLKASRHQIWDRATGGFRAVEYSDMVVLLRATTGRTEVFAKAFHRAGVPLQAGRAGFLAAQEVTDVLNLLRLLDNPLQDLPLLAVLRSPFVGLSAEELVRLRMMERHGLLWNALLRSGEPGVNSTSELTTKLQAFREQLQSWRDLIRHSSLTHCIETTLIETHYESLLLAGERGQERVANVRRLIDMARRFDPFQREGLFRFLQFINEQEEAEVSHQPAGTTYENAVRVITIHASKGLEFPIVVVAGLGGRFNLRDLSSDILLNEDIGLAPKILPPNTRSKYPSIAHWLAAQRERRAALGEELRLLYVALTRARDSLVLVGTASRKDEADRWQSPAPVTDHALLKANTYLDWLRLWFANETKVSDWQDGNAGANGLLSWQFHAANVATETLGDPPSDQDPDALIIPTPNQLTESRNRIALRYSHESEVLEPAKTTVTAIRRRLADETDDEARKLFQPAVSSQVFPTTRAGSTKLSAAEVGIAHHTFQQFVAIHRTATELDLRNEAEQMREAGGLTEEQFAALDFDALSNFWQSEIGAKLRKLPVAAINREMPFTARVSAKELPALNALRPDGSLAVEDFIVVQGQVDLAVLLPDEIWLLDFKTDRVGIAELPAKVTHYEPQLKIYALALARIYQRPVTQCWLHFLTAHRTIPIEPPACI